ncbi:MAG TPA: hypothetical protein VN725_07270 [Rhodanobacteraceae bacterium]|nr:hypothetical protein [Rhodanobacteraceae bacterium]
MINRDLLLGRCTQCRARMRQAWARLRGDRQLGTRSIHEYLHGAARARYGHSRALAESRLRRLERGL